MRRVRHDLASRGEDEGQRLVRNFVDAIVRHVANGNAALAGFVEVHVVHTDAVAHDGLRLGHGGNDVRVHSGELGDDGVRVGAERNEVGLGFALARDDFDTVRFQDGFLDAEVGERPVGDGDSKVRWIHDWVFAGADVDGAEAMVRSTFTKLTTTPPMK